MERENESLNEEKEELTESIELTEAKDDKVEDIIHRYVYLEDLDGNENSHKFEDRFLGWKVEGSSDDILYTTDPNAANGTTLLSLWDYVVKENVTFIAQWEKGKKVSVDVDGGYYSYYSPIDKFYDNYSAYFLSGEKISYHVSYPYKDGKLLLAWENTNTGERYTQNEFERIALLLANSQG